MSLITRFVSICLIDALMSFIIFQTTTHYLFGPGAGQVAFYLGMVLCFSTAKEAVDQETAIDTVKRTTGYTVVEGEFNPGSGKQMVTRRR